jgi:hypothetical protein
MLGLQPTGRSINPMPEIIDPVFAKTSQNARFLLSENERFGLVFVKTGSINSGTSVKTSPQKYVFLEKFSNLLRVFSKVISLHRHFFKVLVSFTRKWGSNGPGNQGGQFILFSVVFTPPPHTRQYLALRGWIG